MWCYTMTWDKYNDRDNKDNDHNNTTNNNNNDNQVCGVILMTWELYFTHWHVHDRWAFYIVLGDAIHGAAMVCSGRTQQIQ